MFESLQYSKPLDEDLFEEWLEKGRNHKLGYEYLLIIWNMHEEDYHPVFLERREEIFTHTKNDFNEVAVAAYDLFSESRIPIE